MAIEVFQYRPKSTWGVTIEVTTDFTCSNAPVVSGRLCGLRQFGFLLCYEDKVQTYLHDWRIIECEKDECENAIYYEIEVKFLVSCEVGVGIGIGNFGTGAFGFPTKSAEETEKYKTVCICCDSEIENERVRKLVFQQPVVLQEKRSPVPLVIGLLAIVALVAASYTLEATHHLADYLLLGVLIGILASCLVVFARLRRLAKYSRRTIKDELKNKNKA